MNWFPGTIAEAVNVSKAKNAIFVVYSEGTNELSTTFSLLINDDRIRTKLESDDFVAIKVQSDSESYKQFAQIYKLVPFPSLFFIGKNGTPIEIVTGITKSVDELEAKIDGILVKAGQKPATMPATASANLLASERAADGEETETVCENGVCYKRPVQKKDETTASTAASSSNQSAQNSAYMSATEERLRRAKELIDMKRKEKEEEATKLAKERETQRRRVGQDLQSFKDRQEESELKKMQEERKRDKIEEQAARKRILEQIAQDKAERTQRFNQSIGSPPVIPPANENVPVENRPPIVSDSTIARIQFKKPDGETEVKAFGSSEPFSVVRTFVEENVIVATGIREFALATAFPRKEFKGDDNPKTMLELGLVPSAVILILPLDKATSRKLPIQSSYGLLAMLTTVFWGIVNPMTSAFAYIRTRLFARNRSTGAAKRSNENEMSPNDVAKRRYLQMNPQQPKEGEPSSAYKRVAGSNIHRLHETKDSDDENATWNGNSTQQQ